MNQTDVTMMVEEIPNGWRKGKLSELVHSPESGGRPKGGASTETGKIPSIGAEFLTRDGRLNYKGMKFIPKEYFINMNSGKLQGGDILICKDGALTGKVAFYENSPYDEAAVNEHVFILRPINGDCRKFIFYSLQSDAGQNKIRKIMTGSAQPGINTNFLKYYDLLIPTKKEQEKIADILSTIDETIFETDGIIKYIQNTKKGLMQEFFDMNKLSHKKGLVLLGNHAYVKARIGWRGLSSSEYTSEGPYLIAGQHIKGSKILWDSCDHLSQFRYDESPEIQLKVGDIIISKDGTIGRLGFIDNLPGQATINGTMMLIRSIDSKVFLPKYFYYYFQGPTFQKIIKEKVSGSSVPHIFQRDIVKLKIPQLDIGKQNEIAEILTNLDLRIEFEKDKKIQLETVKKSLMQKLLSGEIRVKVN